MQGSEDEMPSECGSDGGVYCFPIAHFSNQNNIWILTQGRSQGIFEFVGMQADFSLSDQGAVGGVDIFNRIFNRDNFAI